MTNYSTGHDAEKRAAQFLSDQGFKVLELNWRNRWCEIDIVAKKDKVIYFTEVKFRQNGANGSSLDYITPKKLKQMAFAAEFWVSTNKYDGDYCLAALGIDNERFTLIDLIE
ncbi:MAG: YraN family protein [Candidatus Saccharibacteria bacterium]|nr:YraN family protein [Candidatus Saccharibacteria bacterium]